MELELTIKVVSAIAFGFMMGLEREITGKMAGLRTHILVCVGACVFTILSLHGFQHHIQEGLNGINDPARIAAQIITGIGFIGAGAVMRHGTTVSGITTAATLWVSASVGMACGCGMYYLAGLATLSTLVVLIAIGYVERSAVVKKLAEKRRKKICEDTSPRTM